MTATDPDHPRHGAGRRGPGTRSRAARVLTVVGICLLVFGVVCLGYVGYQLFGTNAASEQSYKTERQQLKQKWQSPEPEATGSTTSSKHKKVATHAVPGDAIGLVSIPAIGVHEIPILQGTGTDELARGVGHYTGTADAGQVGNFALAGHRITHGEPFAKLLQLKKDDQVVVETRSAIYTYEMDTSPRKLTVEDTEGWVLDPVPGKKNAKPTKKLLTLTTCQDLFHSPDRSVGFGHLTKTQKK